MYFRDVTRNRKQSYKLEKQKYTTDPDTTFCLAETPNITQQ